MHFIKTGTHSISAFWKWLNIFFIEIGFNDLDSYWHISLFRFPSICIITLKVNTRESGALSVYLRPYSSICFFFQDLNGKTIQAVRYSASIDLEEKKGSDWLLYRSCSFLFTTLLLLSISLLGLFLCSLYICLLWTTHKVSMYFQFREESILSYYVVKSPPFAFLCSCWQV